MDMRNLKFQPYPYSWIDEDGKIYKWLLISLTIENHVIRLTNYHAYVGDKKKTKQRNKQNKDEIRRICNFLNFVLFQEFWRYKVTRVSQIPFEAVQAYLRQYSITQNRFDGYPSAQSVEKERNAICMFMHNISGCCSKKKEHYYARRIKSSKSKDKSIIEKKREHVYWEYEIQAEYMGDVKYNLVRDIPQDAIPVILNWVQLKAPELYFAAVLQLCAGLREGEVVNVRRATSCFLGGISFSKENGSFTEFNIDLTNEYQLRSDKINVGNIKKKRTQSVYPPFLKLVQHAYENHLKITQSKNIEIFAPMFTSKYMNQKTKMHMAITKEAYCNRIKAIMQNYVVPELLKSESHELKTFALSVNESSWGLHAFRHWYTVQLVLNGEDVNSIAFLRGDSSVQSAFWYVQNKGILLNRFAEINNQMSDNLLNRLSEMKV